jgi:uncharacterized HAD superfamily protein
MGDMDRKSLQIAVDIDGVLLDFIDGFIPVVRERLGVTISHELILTHDLHLLLGISREEMWEIVNETLATKVFPAIPGAVEGFGKLDGHEITLVTSRPSVHEQRTRDNLSLHGFIVDKIIFRNYLKKFTDSDGTDVLIEDSLEEALLASQYVHNVLLFEQPWNRYTMNVKDRVIRVKDWDEVVGVIQELGNG